MKPAAGEAARGRLERRQIGQASWRERDSDGLRLTFSFASATPAALFRRADAVWLVFDSKKPLDVEPIRAKGGALIGDVNRLRSAAGAGDPPAPQPSANPLADRRATPATNGP